MIKAEAKLSIRRIPLAHLQVTETISCFPEKFAIYLDVLHKHPDQDVDPLIVAPSTTHPGMFAIQNGKHRYCASIMAGRKDALCVVIEEPKDVEVDPHRPLGIPSGRVKMVNANGTVAEATFTRRDTVMHFEG